MPQGQNSAICSKCGGLYITGDCIDLDGKCPKCERGGEGGYESYEDWYDHGPGSEAFKREMNNPSSPKVNILQKIKDKARVKEVKKKISKIMVAALSGQDKDLRTADGFIRWGLVEQRIHKAINECWEIEDE